MQQKDSESSRNLQRRIFGDRYVGASLAKITNIPGGSVGKISEWITTNSRSFLILLGPPGTGKTYFCAAMLDSLPAHIQFVRGYNEKNFLRRIRESISNYNNGDYLTELQSMIDDDLIILDDFGSSGYTDWREEVLLEAIDFRYNLRKPTIFTSNLSKQEIFGIYGNRIGSRLFAQENLIIDLFGNADLRQEGF